MNNQRKEAGRKAADAEHARELQNMRAAADREREEAVAAALQQGRNEGAQAAAAQRQAMPVPPQGNPEPHAQQSLPHGENPVVPPDEEVLYNEYGEPVMVRRRVRKTAYSPDGEMLYDRNGNPVIRRNQGLWEPLEQRHEIVVKVETSPGVTVSRPENPASSGGSSGRA